MLRAVFLAVALCAAGLNAQTQPPPLKGSIANDVYTSSAGRFSIPLPVLPQLGGEILDTPNVVTFKDHFNTFITVAGFPMDATERWEYSTQGAKDYLVGFFRTVVLDQFRRDFPTMRVEGGTGTFIPSLQGGAFIAFFLLPDGSEFTAQLDPFAASPAQQHPVAKRANIVFVRNNVNYILSTELAERVTEGLSYKKTPEEENQLLRKRIDDLVSKMSFPAPAKPASP